MSEKKLNIVQVEMFPPNGILKTNFRLLDELGVFNKIVGDFSNCEAFYDQAVAGLQKVHVDSSDASSFGIDAQYASRKMSDLRVGVKLVVLAHLTAAIKCSKPLAVELPDRSFRMAEVADHEDLLTKAREARGFWVFLFEPNDILATDGLQSVGKIM
jgi:hypothetical protein